MISANRESDCGKVSRFPNPPHDRDSAVAPGGLNAAAENAPGDGQGVTPGPEGSSIGCAGVGLEVEGGLGPVAQGIEQRFPKAKVAGSNPARVTADERWLPAAGYAPYEVSSEGRVRRGPAGRILRPYANDRRNGRERYRVVCLSIGGRKVQVTVHRLVAGAFLPPPAAGKDQVDHLNGVGSDNRAANLEWVSSKENTRRWLAAGARGRAVRRSDGRFHRPACPCSTCADEGISAMQEALRMAEAEIVLDLVRGAA